MNISIVLVRPKYPRNIGMVSRIMENFGLERLVILAPRCELDEDAREGAAQGQAPLRNAIQYSDWDAFLASEPEGPRVAFSRRSGRRRPSFPISEMSTWEALTPVDESASHLHLIFGTEDHGLSAEDLEIAHRTSFFELPGQMKSMNLSHAVLFALSQLMPFMGSLEKTPKTELASAEKIALPDLFLKEWLVALNFDLSQNKWNAYIALRQMLMKSAPTTKEMELFRSVVQQTLRRLRGQDATTKDTPKR